MLSGLGGLLNSIISMVKSMEAAPPGNRPGFELFLPQGTETQARIIAQKGDFFLVEIEGKQTLAKAEVPLAVGTRLPVVVQGQADEMVILQVKTEDNSLKEPEDKKAVTLLAKKLVQRLPVDEQTAIRLLFDPNLIAALVVPSAPEQGFTGQIEVKGFKSQGQGEMVWEIAFALDWPNLGAMEVVLRYTQESSSLRIWAASAQTSELLASHRRDLQDICPLVEIVPVNSGPLIYKGPLKNLDIKA